MKKATKKVSKAKQLEQLRMQANAAYILYAGHDAVETEIAELVSDYGYRMQEAIQELESDLVGGIELVAQRHGRGLVRAALSEAGFPDFDVPVWEPEEFMEHERGWQDETADCEEALTRVTAECCREPQSNFKVQYDEKGNFTGVVGNGHPAPMTLEQAFDEFRPLSEAAAEPKIGEPIHEAVKE